MTHYAKTRSWVMNGQQGGQLGNMGDDETAVTTMGRALAATEYAVAAGAGRAGGSIEGVEGGSLAVKQTRSWKVNAAFAV